MKSSSTGNLQKLLVGSLLGPSKTNAEFPSKGARNSHDLNHKSGNDDADDADDKPRGRRRSSSVTRLMDALRNSVGSSSNPASSSLNISDEFSVDNNNKEEKRSKPRRGQRSTRSRSRTRLTKSSSCDRSTDTTTTPRSHSNNPFDNVDGLSLDEIDAKLKSLKSNRSKEEEIMADMFKTAGELEDMAKAARRARRRKTGGRRLPRRSKSGISQASVDSSSHDGSGGSGGADDSKSFTDAILSTFHNKKTQQQPPAQEPPKRRSSFNGGLLNRGGGGIGGGSHHHRHQPQAPQQQKHTKLDLTPIELPDHLNFKPTFYHDSDDEDDDLVLDPDEDMDEFSRQIERDVRNMVICVRPKAA